MPVIPIRNPQLSEQEQSYLITAGTASTTILYVADYSGFTANKYLVLGPYGKEKADITKISSSDPTSTTISLAATPLPKYAHPVNTRVSVLPYNQYEISSSATEGGTYTVLNTGTIQVDNEYTYYDDTAGSSATWYRVRYYNSTDIAYSDYSDAVQAAGYKANSRGRLKNMVKSLFGDKYEKWVDDDDLNNFFYQIESEVFEYRKRWTFLQGGTVFSLTEGKHAYNLTDNIYDIKAPEKKYIENVWIDTNDPLAYNDRKEMDELLESADFTQLSAALAVSDTTASVYDAEALTSSGTVVINGDYIGYTGRNSRTSLTGLTGISPAHSSGDYVWQKDELDEPTDYTIWGGELIMNVAPDTNYALHVVYQKKGIPMSEDNATSQIPWATTLVIDGVLALCYAAKQDQAMYKEKRAEFEKDLQEKSFQERSGQKLQLVPSEREGYREWEDYKDFDKGDLRLVRNKYRTS